MCNGTICIFAHCRIHQREHSVYCHNDYSIECSYTSERMKAATRWYTTNQVDQFIIIIEEMSVIMRKGLELEAKYYQKEEHQSSQLCLPFYFKIQCNISITSFKKLKAIPTEVIIRKDTISHHHSLLTTVKDARITAMNASPIPVIGCILPLFPPHDLYMFSKAINTCQESLTHELVLKAAANYFRHLTKHYANYVTTINSLNTISYYLLSSEQFLFHLPWDFYGQTCEFCLIHWLDSLENPVDCQKCLRYQSEVNLIQLCDLKRRPFLRQRRLWSQIFGHIITTFFQVWDDLLLYWWSNCKGTKGEVIWPLLTLMDLNEIPNLINKKN